MRIDARPLAGEDIYVATGDIIPASESAVGGKKAGTIALTFSLTRMRSNLIRTCRTDFCLVLAVGLAALLLIYRLIQRLVIKPLGRLQAATVVLASGRVSAAGGSASPG